MASAKRVPGSRHTPETIERGLLALALTGGNAIAARKQLQAQGHDIPRATLDDWRRKHHDRYQHHAQTNARRVEELITTEARETIRLAAQLEQAALHRALETLPAHKDPATAARQAAVVKGINIDKTLALEGRPQTTTRIELQADDLIAKLARLAPTAVQAIDTDAQELPAPTEPTEPEPNHHQPQTQTDPQPHQTEPQQTETATATATETQAPDATATATETQARALGGRRRV